MRTDVLRVRVRAKVRVRVRRSLGLGLGLWFCWGSFSMTGRYATSGAWGYAVGVVVMH